MFDRMQPLLLPKMKTLLKILVCSTIVIIMVACATSNALYKKGNQLSSAGMNKEAADFFYNSLNKNANNVDSRIALKGIGQKVLEEQLQKFYQAHGADQYKVAVYSYRSAMTYKEKMSRFVELDVPPYYEGYYNESKDVYLGERYIDAKKLIKEEKFDQANEVLEEILKIDKNYKDASQLEKYSDAEPLYREAMGQYDSKKYRTAYYQFDRVLNISANYKDAVYYKEEALKKGRLTIAVLPVIGSGVDKETADLMYTALMQKLLELNNPFIVAIDRKNTDLIIKEQKLGLTGVLDQNTAAQTGKMLGAKAVLSGTASGSSYKEIPVKRREERGYKKVTRRKYDAVKKKYYNVYSYSKTTYYTFSGSRKVSANVQIQLVSSETGQVLLSKNYNPVITDNLDYADVSGPSNDIYSGYWKYKIIPSTQDVVEKSSSAKRQLDRLFAERRRTMKTKTQLTKEMSDDIALKIAREIKSYEKSRE